MNSISRDKNMKMPVTLSRYAIVLALVVAFLLLIPWVAMKYNTGVNWSPIDFAVAGILLFGAGLTYQLAARKIGNIVYKIAVGISVFTSLFLVWSNLAVGLIGNEKNNANLMYLGVLAIVIIAAFIARFKPYGMAIALYAAAVVQSLVTIIAIAAGLGSLENTPVQLILINGFFIALWVVSGLLFQYAARRNK